ncbi:MAG TPA: enolase C-terminal domain-like protein, partial [Flavobacteriales bacterium]|nr:enolase C-terminal domain-like protein [Flavobacteriales bacterium]
GTDSVFVRLTNGERVAYGEATLPPYLKETQHTVHEELVSFWLNMKRGRLESNWGDATQTLSSPARAAFQMAYNGLNNRDISSKESSDDNGSARGLAMVTVGMGQVDDIALKLSELPFSPVLKVKLGSSNDLLTIEMIKRLDNRKIFLDANQGWSSVDHALRVIEAAGPAHVIGLEQPFPKDRWDLHQELKSRTDVPIYADESIQGPADLERAPEVFDGVNLKLMKCGGLDIAEQMAERARELGLRVMLGSMSESSLGCGTMALLADRADLLDLDGPWLIKNDPFTGLRMEQGKLVLGGSGPNGVELREPSPLEFITIGA